ncbi:hypothetical protein GT755_12380 [Herbidospora sp. NEAU-GS84]|uniref:Uncharacterized protein n=2 Tax=Herbidospora solisilvae TaxID=2696284 RepID=A0A7C9JTN1_9ACTN|nr:hypothetical protein [Herbidospora solisilvae]
MPAPPRIAFLRARLDEDEREAQAGAQLHDGEPADPSYADGIADLEAAGWEPQAAQRFNRYVAHFDPARALRDIASKRKILEEHGPERVREGWNAERDICQTCRYDEGLDTFPYGHCPTVVALAEPYAEHPDYPKDSEWAPT